MKTKISTKGQVVLPSPIRNKLGLRAGDPLDAKVEGGRIVLTPHRTRTKKVTIVADPSTGLPVLSAGPDASLLSSKQVEEILASFP
jgi:AbrB family looped-hinge helix DNA binding protein